MALFDIILVKKKQHIEIKSMCFLSGFICSLFPENLNTDKKSRPTTASSKIKVGAFS